jgi:hypothetical protein
VRDFILLIACALALGACASAPGVESDGNLDAFGHLLGESRATVELHTQGLGAADIEGWVAYDGGLKVLYEGTRAVAISQKVPRSLNCKEAARWAGFSRVHSPLLRKGRCIWPADDPVHWLGPRLSGTLHLGSRILVARITP